MKKVMYVVSRYEFSDLNNPIAMFTNYTHAWYWARNKAAEEAGWDENDYCEWSKIDYNEETGFGIITYKETFRECGFIIRKCFVHYEIEP